MQKILLTRSAEENLTLSEAITKLGFQPVLCPMLLYEIVPCDFASFIGTRDIIITSKMAAKIVAAHYPYEVDCWVVGEESANILRQNLHITIKHITENAEALKSQPIPTSAAIYFSGNIITTSFEVATRHIVYDVTYAAELSEKAIEAIKSGVEYIMLYSKNCASNLKQLLVEHNLLQTIENSVVIAISKEVASIFEGSVGKLLFPDVSTSDGMLKLLADYDTSHKQKT